MKLRLLLLLLGLWRAALVPLVASHPRNGGRLRGLSGGVISGIELPAPATPLLGVDSDVLRDWRRTGEGGSYSGGVRVTVRVGGRGHLALVRLHDGSTSQHSEGCEQAYKRTS